MKHQDTLLTQWLAEEQAAHMLGWDFSHIHGRYQEEEDLPWDYKASLRRSLFPSARILDMDTGGGEFLLSLHHPCRLISATEAYPPNAALCRQTLTPLGIDFHEAEGNGPLPFPSETFDLVLNRHGDYLPQEVFRVLKPGGIFLTQQVGAENDRELVSLLLNPVPPLPFPAQYLTIPGGMRLLYSGGFGGFPVDPLLGCGRTGLVCPDHPLGVSWLLGGALPGRSPSGSGDPGLSGCD